MSEDGKITYKNSPWRDDDPHLSGDIPGAVQGWRCIFLHMKRTGLQGIP